MKKHKLIIYIFLFFIAVALLSAYSQRNINPNNANIAENNEGAPVEKANLNDLDKIAIQSTPTHDLLVNDRNFQVYYLKSDKQFLISILGYPFDKYRIDAEDQLMNKLGLNKEEACKLNIVETTPMFANPDKAGENYKLSFCD